MSRPILKIGDKVTVCVEGLEDLFRAMESGGYKIIGPTVRDNAVIFDRLSSPAELPKGWSEKTDSGRYRLAKDDSPAYFGFTLGPQSWKKFLFPPKRRLWSAEKDRMGFNVIEEKLEPEKLALFGVRPCELAALMVLDKVFGEGPYRDPLYKEARKKALIIAVNCGKANGTCFCVSMGTGPKASSGFDISITEVFDGDRQYLVFEIGSENGAALMGKVSSTVSTPAEQKAAEKVSSDTARAMGRSLDTNNIKAILERNFDNPRWEAAAKRCLTCGNCTMVCPTCFCSTVEDITDLTGKKAERWQRWDSCYTMAFSYIHGGSIRPSTKARYRQMVTHKLAAWNDQFGVSGCVGCGRCITWCPAGIDITEEVRAIRESDVVGTSQRR